MYGKCNRCCLPTSRSTRTEPPLEQHLLYGISLPFCLSASSPLQTSGIESSDQTAKQIYHISTGYHSVPRIGSSGVKRDVQTHRAWESANSQQTAIRWCTGDLINLQPLAAAYSIGNGDMVRWSHVVVVHGKIPPL